jgi:hypothetical protein
LFASRKLPFQVLLLAIGLFFNAVKGISRALVHVWTAPRMQEENENSDGRVDCDHVSGLFDAAS